MSTINPLLAGHALPLFDQIRPEHITPAMTHCLAEGDKLIAQLTSPTTPTTWNDFVMPLSVFGEKLSRVWGPISHLHHVQDTPALREAYNENQPKYIAFWTAIGQNLALFEKYKTLRAQPEFVQLSAEQRCVIDHAIRDFRLSGADIDEALKPRYADIQAQRAQLATRFTENIVDSQSFFHLIVTEASELEGLPEDVIASAADVAEHLSIQGWCFTLHMPSYLPIMQYAQSRALRERMYRAYTTQASECFPEFAGGKIEWDNTQNINDILQLRLETAQLLGFTHYADLSLAQKMAENPAQVMDFLRDLARRSKPFAERDMAELTEFAQTTLNIDRIMPWDLAWASEKLRIARYAFSEQNIRQYFQANNVLQGLFHVAETLFQLHIKSDQTSTWHPDVQFFRIENQQGELIGQFYFDLFAREGKQPGAWMDTCVERYRMSTGIQLPVAYLTCNFTPPLHGKPSLLTHNDVITLFHEFGHGLHHLLTEVETLGISGINGVEWDAIELPSQFMENFCWEWTVLQDMTAHIDTGEKLPRALYDKMIAAKNFQAGMQFVRQLEFSLFDMALHTGYDPTGTETVLDLLNTIRTEVAVIIPPAYNRFPMSFSHIFSGGYAAGYYSYKWAEVLSADAYAAFEEAAVQRQQPDTLAPDMGLRFRKEILAVGGSRPAMDSFKAFRGRAPQPDALLRHNGLSDAT